MAVPKFFEFFEAFLLAVKDGDIHTTKDVYTIIAANMNLADSDLQELIPSGKQTVYYNRIAWAKTYLHKAGLIEIVTRGKYRITENGKKALESNEKIDIKYLEKFKQFKEFHRNKNSNVDTIEIEIQEKNESPMELFDATFEQINNVLSSQLIDEIMRLTPPEFERLVVKLLLKMGYGNGIVDAGTVTKQSNDGGIDGIIKEDQLGFSNIYIQAKKWDLTQTVGSPELQQFVGALQSKQAQKGLFITTTKFSNKAVEYAKNLLGVKIVLIDGITLTKLMIKHNVGVSVEHIYEIKRLDSDFFTEEL